MSPAPQQSRLLLTIAVMSAAFIQVLDTTIVNIALPQMAGELSATPDQISWVLTSYLVAGAVIMPLTGYFSDRWGQRKLLLLSIFGFVVSSGLCGIATSLPEMVLFRVLQGVCGAPLIPLSQSILVQAFSAHERGRAMAIWGMGIMVAPILGPTLGGYLTDALNWRWTFYINLPLGALSLLLALRTVPDTTPRPRPIDWLGLALMFVAIGGLQFIIDRGNREDWFESTLIQTIALLSAASFLAFIYRSLAQPQPTLLDLRLFRDRNFSTGCALVTMFQISMFGAILLGPLYLENLLGYPASTAGLLMAPRGIAALISMLAVGRLITRFTPRNLMLVGIALWTLGSFPMMYYSLDVGLWFLIWPAIVQGFALGLIFVPGATITYATLPRSASAEAAGMYNLIRTVGSGIGISIAATLFARQTQVAWSEIGSNIQPFNPALETYLGRLGLELSDPNATAMLARELGRQAQMVGMVDAFAAVAWSFVLMLPLVFLLQRGFPHQQTQPAVVPK